MPINTICIEDQKKLTICLPICIINKRNKQTNRNKRNETKQTKQACLLSRWSSSLLSPKKIRHRTPRDAWKSTMKKSSPQSGSTTSHSIALNGSSDTITTKHSLLELSGQNHREGKSGVTTEKISESTVTLQSWILCPMSVKYSTTKLMLEKLK